MRLFLPLAALLVLPLHAPLYAQGAAPVPSTVKVNALAQRESALYHRGETVTFVVKVSDKEVPVSQGELEWTLLKDGLPLNRQGKAEIRDGQATVSGTLDEPGFLQLRATYRSDPKAPALTALAGAGIDPAEIAPSLPIPDDFDAFWTAQKALLAQIPPQVELSPVSSPAKTVEAFDLQAKCVGAPVSGYFARPLEAKPKSLPIILTVHGAGVRGSSLGSATGWASKGFLAMDINAHGLPNGKPEEFYKEQTEGALKDYRYRGRDSREDCYFRGMFLRLVRALDVLTAQPEWDGKTVVVYGSSQGGYQAIVAAGLDSRVTFFGAGVPAGCDHTGMMANRIAGWPKLVELGAEGKPEAKGLEAARYFDAMNFATRAKAAGCCFTVGFIDTTCPPSSVYAAYNQIKGPKHIENDVPSGHAHSAKASSAMAAAVAKHVEEQKLKSP
jgi:cephalosporin-C deacetylase-like acetyl esterase